MHVPVFLARAPLEPVDEDLHEFYRSLLSAVDKTQLHEAEWELCECTGWPDNQSAAQLVAWCWSTRSSRHLVIVNLAGAPAQARVHPPWQDLGGREWALVDRLSGAQFRRSGDELAVEGLYVGLDGWGAHLLSFAV